jgi:hypothetical protein
MVKLQIDLTLKMNFIFRASSIPCVRTQGMLDRKWRNDYCSSSFYGLCQGGKHFGIICFFIMEVTKQP